MTPFITGINLRQYGLQRIDITAIVMLLIALSIVLVTNLPHKDRTAVEQAATPVQAPSAANAGAVTATLGFTRGSTRGLTQGALSLSPDAGEKTETP